ncbi:hypothetical protein FRC00_012355 [Tulasnella sp. 408]|nr:hypothetical protein FRC00_012355 [Tulasnella sp. 408]
MCIPTMSSSAQQPSIALTKLKESLSGEVVCPGDDGYDYGIARWSENCVKKAGYVIFPKTNEDVVEGIKFARSQNLELAIYGGGHSYSGSSSTEGGVVIHLGKYINYARCDPEKCILYVGGGATWEIVEKVGMEHGLATVAGNVNHTGVGGLALGGGYGWLTGRHGMVVDNTVQYTVVLASGEVVIANEKEHPALFWGCRGGGCNFGIVTEFVFKAHPQRSTVFVASFMYTIDKLDSLLNAVENWEATTGPDEGLRWGCMRVLPGIEPGTPTLMAMYFYNGDAADGRKGAKRLHDIGPIAEKVMEDLPFVQLNALQNDLLPREGRKYVKGLTTRFPTSVEAIQAVLQAQDEVVKSNPALVHCGVLFDCCPKKAVMAVPLEATAYAGRGTGAEGVIFQFYTDPALDDSVHRQVREWAQILSEKTPVAFKAGKGGESYGVSYTNFDPDAAASDAARVFGPNYKRLREVKRKYDPDNIWNRENCVKKAGYVVFPKTNEDVVEAIKFARGQNLDLAIYGGGHSYSGSSSTEGGLVIHLGKYLNYARCDPEKRLLYSSSTSIIVIHSVEKVGMEHGLATVAGNVNHTGVGGLALGGGYGWLTGRHGMTVDNTVQYTVVLASGEVVTANEKENPDLFWGCRGGGCNFGVVTEFVFKAHPQRPTVFITNLIYTVDKLESLLNAVEDWHETAGPDEGLHWACMRVLPGMEPGKAALVAMFFFNGDAAEGRKAAKKLYDVGPIAEKAMEDLPFVQLNALQNDSLPRDGRKYIKGLTTRFRMSAEAVQAVLQAQDEVVKSNPALVHCGVLFDCCPKKAVAAVPLEATAYAGRGTGAEGGIFQFYTDPALDESVQRQVRAWAQIL